VVLGRLKVRDLNRNKNPVVHFKFSGLEKAQRAAVILKNMYGV
jgi:hypothetical protein